MPQPLGSPLLEFLLMDGNQARQGLTVTLQAMWRGYRQGGVGGALIAFVSNIAGPTGSSGLGAMLDAFRSAPGTDPLLRDLLTRRERTGGLTEAMDEETISILSTRTGLPPAAVMGRLSKTLPATRQALRR